MTTEEALTLVGNVEIVISAVLAVACVVAYQIKTRGRWYRRDAAMHIMIFMIVVAVVLVVAVFRIIGVEILGRVEPIGFQLLRVVTFAFVPVVLGWRLLIIIGAVRWGPSDTRDKETENHDQ